MTDPKRLEEFRASLQQNIMYKVEGNKNYTHVRPSDMSLEDLQKLAEKASVRGKDSLLEGYIADLNKYVL